MTSETAEAGATLVSGTAGTGTAVVSGTSEAPGAEAEPGPPDASTPAAGSVAPGAAAPGGPLAPGPAARTLILGIDLSGRILQCDRHAPKLLGRSPGELLGAELGDLTTGT